MNEPIDMERRMVIGSSLVAIPALSACAAVPQSGAMRSERYDRGLKALQAVGGAGYSATVKALERVSPDFADLLVASTYGDVIARPGLSLRTRELVSVAAVSALGKAPAALRFHIGGMLETGWTPREVVETLLHVLVYAGFPAAQDAIDQARVVFRERGINIAPTSGRPSGDDWKQGVLQLFRSGGDEGLQVAQRAIDVDSLRKDLDRLTVEFAHGEVWNRPDLSMKDRAFATLAMAIAVGNLDETVRFYASSCLRLGWTQEQLVELLMQMPTYVGWPQALSSLAAFLDGIEKAETTPAQSDFAVELAGSRTQARSDADRYRAGLAALARISQSSGEAVVASFSDIVPDLGRYIVEFSYADVFSRPGLDLKTRELASVAALTASGRHADMTPIKVHISAALNVGATQSEVLEAIMHVLPYAGFSRVQAAEAIALEVFSARRG
jgi:4-carboxymuconolactone decarboxylase